MTFSLNPATDVRTVASVRDMAPLQDFHAAAQAVLGHLSSVFDLTLWMVTRAAGDDHVVLGATSSPFGVVAGDVFSWSDVPCSRMVRGEGPRVARSVADVPAYAACPAVRAMSMQTYVGIPLTGPDGELFGTLCGIDAAPSSAALVEGQPLLELQARLLSSVLAAEIRDVRAARDAELERRRRFADPLDRASWTALLRSEGRRCSPHATPASVIAFDVRPAAGYDASTGNGVVERILRTRSRPADVLARTGPTSYSVLCPETPEAVAQVLATELLVRLHEGGAPAAVGVAALDPRDGDLAGAWHRAEAVLLADCSASPYAGAVR